MKKRFLFLRFGGYTQICPRAARRQRNLKNDMAKVAEVAKK